jgi:hypothetical protein
MAELVQKDGEKEETDEHGSVEPTSMNVVLVGDVQDHAEGHEREQTMHADRDAEHPP